MSNCLIFALSLWFTRGGYLIARKSRHTWVPHFMWAPSLENIEIEEYIPNDCKVRAKLQHPIIRWLPIGVILFRGKIRRKRGDEA